MEAPGSGPVTIALVEDDDEARGRLVASIRSEPCLDLTASALLGDRIKATRRRFLRAAGALAAVSLGTWARASDKISVLGILSPHRKPSAAIIANNPFINRLRVLGWAEGGNLRIERAYGEGREDRLPELAAGLVAKRVDVIWAFGPEAAIAAARATRSIPVVFWGVALPVEQGLVASLARPGRNVTGVAWYAAGAVDLKRMQYLKEIAPNARRLAHLAVPSAASTVAGGSVLGRTEETARALGFDYRRFEMLNPADFAPRFEEITQWSADAMLVAGTTLTVREAKRIVEFARQRRLPDAYTLRSFVEIGGLIGYAIVIEPTFARCADYIDQILRGAKPGNLPVDLPSEYTLAVNLKTARELGLTVPQSILLRADLVIE